VRIETSHIQHRSRSRTDNCQLESFSAPLESAPMTVRGRIASAQGSVTALRTVVAIGTGHALGSSDGFLRRI